MSAPRATSVSLERRQVCRWLLVPVAQLVVPSAVWGAHAKIASARLWPAQEYTRVIVEAPVPIPHNIVTLKDPNRVVLELQGAELTPDLAQRENAADLIGGVNLEGREPTLARTLLDLSQAAQISDSLKVGRHMLDSIGAINPLHKGAVEQAGFAVLKAPDIPSILVETAFISNPDEELKLRSERHQAAFAESMRDGIRHYFAANPPLARRGTGTG